MEGRHPVAPPLCGAGSGEASPRGLASPVESAVYGTVAKKASLGFVARSTAIPKNGWNTFPFVVSPS